MNHTCLLQFTDWVKYSTCSLAWRSAPAQWADIVLWAALPPHGARVKSGSASGYSIEEASVWSGNWTTCFSYRSNVLFSSFSPSLLSLKPSVPISRSARGWRHTPLLTEHRLCHLWCRRKFLSPWRSAPNPRHPCDKLHSFQDRKEEYNTLTSRLSKLMFLNTEHGPSSPVVA